MASASNPLVPVTGRCEAKDTEVNGTTVTNPSRAKVACTNFVSNHAGKYVYNNKEYTISNPATPATTAYACYPDSTSYIVTCPIQAKAK